MKFNRKLFKEAYKAGYKKAKMVESLEAPQQNSIYKNRKKYRCYVVSPYFDGLSTDDVFYLDGDSLEEVFSKLRANFRIPRRSFGSGALYERKGEDYEIIGDLFFSDDYKEICKEHGVNFLPKYGYPFSIAIDMNSQSNTQCKDAVEHVARGYDRQLNKINFIEKLGNNTRGEINPDYEIVEDENVLYYIPKKKSFGDRLKSFGRGLKRFADEAY